jgi:hypothetical protein
MIRQFRWKLNSWAGTLPDWTGYLMLGVVITPSILAIAALIIMFLWNYLLIWLLPAIPTIDFWRALTVALLWTAIEIYQIWRRNNASH